MQKECTVVDHQVNERSATRSRRLEMSRVTKSVAPPPPRRRTLFVATCCPHLMHDTPDCFLKCFFFNIFFPCLLHVSLTHVFSRSTCFFKHFSHPPFMITCLIVVVFQPKKGPAFSHFWISHMWGTLFCLFVNKLLNVFTS